MCERPPVDGGKHDVRRPRAVQSFTASNRVRPWCRSSGAALKRDSCPRQIEIVSPRPSGNVSRDRRSRNRSATRGSASRLRDDRTESEVPWNSRTLKRLRFGLHFDASMPSTPYPGAKKKESRREHESLIRTHDCCDMTRTVGTSFPLLRYTRLRVDAVVAFDPWRGGPW